MKTTHTDTDLFATFDFCTAAQEPDGFDIPAPRSTGVATATLAEVLQPRPVGPVPRLVKPLDLPVGSAHAEIVSKAASEVRALYNSGVYSPGAGDIYMTACGDTCIAEFEVHSVLDDVTAAIAAAIFKAAGWYQQSLRPVRERVQVEIQMLVIETAKRLRLLLAKQQTLELAGA